MGKCKAIVYWMLLLVVLSMANIVFFMGEAQARYVNTATWDTVVQPGSNSSSGGIVSNCLYGSGDTPVTVLLYDIYPSYEITFSLTSDADVSKDFYWLVDKPVVLSVTTRINDEAVGNHSELELKKDTTVWVTMKFTPLTTPISDITVTVHVGVDDLTGVFLVNPSYEKTGLSGGSLTVPGGDTSTGGGTDSGTTEGDNTTSGGTDPEPTEENTTNGDNSTNTAGTDTVTESTSAAASEPEAQSEESESEVASESTEDKTQSSTRDVAEQTDTSANTDDTVTDDTITDDTTTEDAEEGGTNNESTESGGTGNEGTESGGTGNEGTESGGDGETSGGEDTSTGPEIIEALGSLSPYSPTTAFPVQIYVPEGVYRANLGMKGTHENVPVVGFPKNVRYSLDNGESYYMLAQDGCTILLDGLGGGQYVTILIDLSQTGFTGVDFELAVGFYYGDTLKALAYNAMTSGTSHSIYMPSRILTVDQPLSINITNDWRYCFSYELEMLTMVTQEDGTEKLTYVPVSLEAPTDPEEKQQIHVEVAVTGEGLYALIFSTAEALPPAGTYRVRMYWTFNNTCFLTEEETFFVNYANVEYTTQTGGAEQ